MIVSSVSVTRYLISCLCFVDRCLSFCTFSFGVTVLSVILRYTDSDYPFGICKLFLHEYIISYCFVW